MIPDGFQHERGFEDLAAMRRGWAAIWFDSKHNKHHETHQTILDAACANGHARSRQRSRR